MVWSDPEIRKLSRAFVTVAEEVHFLYPESRQALSRLQDDPAHLLFKRFGEAMPAKDWNHPGTKQGIYMIGPDGEYLEGGGAISGNAAVVRKRLEAALERWAKLRKAKKYANKKVPEVAHTTPPDIEDKALVLRVHLRDLPRGEKDRSGRRIVEADKNRKWTDFTQWAWNENWIGFDDPQAFVPSGKGEQGVAEKVVERLCCDVLVDNVRGQTPRWKRAELESAELQMRRIETVQDRWTIEYRGQARMDSGRQKFAPTLYGRGVWNARSKHFESFDLLAIGMREGHGNFNQRKRDLGPAPMGVALGLYPQ